MFTFCGEFKDQLTDTLVCFNFTWLMNRVNDRAAVGKPEETKFEKKYKIPSD